MHIVFPDDRHEMDWLRPDFPYAAVQIKDDVPMDQDDCAPAIESSVTTRFENNVVTTEIRLRNVGVREYFAGLGDVGITLPLEDRYDLGADQVTKRCNVHLSCAGTSSYVVALRMGGEPPHLGLVLTEGALGAYSIERNTERSSNDRGCFILHPEPFVLAPGEETVLSWRIFGFTDLPDFYRQAALTADFVRLDWDTYVLFPGERATLTITPSSSDAAVTVNGAPVDVAPDGSARFAFAADEPGEHVFHVTAGAKSAVTRILVKAPFAELVERRCRFIATRQQYRKPGSGLDGALLIYDNDTDTPFYSGIRDFNAGRERIGMGLLLGTYLTALQRGALQAAAADTESLLRGCLDAHRTYVLRELVDAGTGEVFDDYQRAQEHHRLYNPPWFATYFMTLYRLDGRLEDLQTALRIVQRFYADGGAKTYPIELPIADLSEALVEVGLTDELDIVQELFAEHARLIVATGTAYPPAEVNYEQSIVAPAAELLLQTAIALDDPTLVEEARPHLLAMEQFQGMQPDYHLNEVSIRHWDGHWFGKRQQFGDTFPHHWSALTGTVFALLHRITGEAGYNDRASRSMRAVLPLIFDNGRASCAYVFPLTVNGEPGVGFDPYANDQDWALFFSTRRVLETGRPTP